jgi:hypothetical protein
MLDVERQFYATHMEEWSRTNSGRFAVVKGEELAGMFATMDEALSAGATRFGLSPFLVRRVGDQEEKISIPALTLGILRANP